jgi:hypothetical protein
MENRNALEME